MSIVALKRKTAAKYNNNSVGAQNGFSLSGTHRNQGYVGQTNQGRFTSRTLMRRGGGISNTGGCCGTFYMAPMVQSGISTVEDSTVIKTATANTQGLLHHKYRWIWRPQPYTSVKNVGANNLNSQRDHIVIVRNNAINDANSCYLAPTCDTTNNCGGSKVYTKPIDFTNDEYSNVATSQGEYLLTKMKACVDDDVSIPGIGCAPFAGSV
jgi:hypothetical protein